MTITSRDNRDIRGNHQINLKPEFFSRKIQFSCSTKHPFCVYAYRGKKTNTKQKPV